MINYPKILYLYSAPLIALDGCPLDTLDITAERGALVQELTTCKKEILLRIGYATVDELAKSIGEEFNILYISSHGHEKFLLFEDGKGGCQPITGDYLKKLIGMGKVELAVVTACYSEKIGKILVEAGIPHVIAVKSDVPVLDHAALVFIGQFFRSLFQGSSVQKAFDMATVLVEGNPELMKMQPELQVIAHKKEVVFVPEKEKFVLLPEDTAAHKDTLLSKKVREGSLTLEEPVLSRTNLPVKPQTFTGRSVEMYDLINELITTRLVTITGAGGIGKTMVAIEVARWFCSRTYFPDGVFSIDLRQTDTVGGIIDLLGTVCGVPLTDLNDMIAYLKERRYLLLLDNAETILWQNEKGMQELIDAILKFTPHTTLLITSQRPVGGNLHEPEHVYRIYPLEHNDAALLFIITAKRRMYKQELESDIFHRLLDQLGGHPLSLVLTACQLVPGVTLEDVMKRIKAYKAKAITVKSITDRDKEHGKSLIASLASAFDSLSENAQTLFKILSLLPAGAEKEMLTKIYGDTSCECVKELNRASLVEVRNQRAALLPPIRLFAVNVCPEKIKVYYGPKILELLKDYTKELYTHHSAQDAKEYRVYFAQDEPNLRSAVDLPCAPFQHKEYSALGILGPRLIFLYSFHHRWKEAKDVGNKILLRLKKVKDHLGEASALLMLGIVATQVGDLEEAQSKYEKALEIYQNIGHERGEANTFWKLGDLIVLLGDLEEARTKYENALEIYQEIDEKIGEANVFLHLGDLIMRSGSLEEAQSKYENALTIYREIDEKLGEGNVFMRLGDLAVYTGAFKEARTKYENALTIFQEIDEKLGEANVFMKLGQWAALTDHFEYAEINLDRALTLSEETENLEVQAETHMAKALVFLKHHDIINAKRELDLCSFIRGKVGAHYNAAKWLILYAIHLRSHKFKEGTKICLEYAEKFAFKTQNQHLQNQVKQYRSELV
ncbi:MAG: tetratricopeptide repeat protein [Candidatus Methanofastidiosia archaeon]|jgi:tetratricopeptide (TPR) repeat protein